VLRSVDVCSEGLNGGDGNGGKRGRQEEQASGEKSGRQGARTRGHQAVKTEEEGL